jgi:hypothetical protein
MRNPGNADKEKVRINFGKSILNAASQNAKTKGLTLSGYIEELLMNDLTMCQSRPTVNKHSNSEER